VERTIKAVPAMLAGEMDKATLLVHTSKPPRPKPPRPEGI
jgi:peptidyl-tRNA hydrolase, PTH1 family